MHARRFARRRYLNQQRLIVHRSPNNESHFPFFLFALPGSAPFARTCLVQRGLVRLDWRLAFASSVAWLNSVLFTDENRLLYSREIGWWMLAEEKKCGGFNSPQSRLPSETIPTIIPEAIRSSSHQHQKNNTVTYM